MAVNQFGLDTSYFRAWIKRVTDCGLNYKPNEFAREMARMSRTADSAVMFEREFCGEKIKALEDRVEFLEEKARLYDAINLAAEKLPFGWQIGVEVEKDGGSVMLNDPSGEYIDFPTGEMDFASQVESALEYAVENSHVGD